MGRDVSKYYSNHAADHDRKWSENELSKEFLQLRNRFVSLTPGRTVLDAGCGAGRDTQYFVEQGLDTTGVDVAKGMIEYARRHSKGDYRVMDMRDLQFENRSFNGVWACASLFFVPKRGMAESLSELHRVLDIGGVLYAGFKLGNHSVTEERWGEEITYHHVTDEEARELLEAEGFEIVESSQDRSKSGTTFGNYFCKSQG